MLMESVAVVAGFALLVWGAERFVLGAASTARLLGVSPLLIGITIVGFGTSAPEILVSAMASLQGNPGLAIGNAIGSNIANIGLIIGVTALIAPLAVHSGTVRRELPILIGITFAVWLLLADGELDALDGWLLLGGLVAMMGWVIHMGLASRSEPDPVLSGLEAEIRTDIALPWALFWLFAGIVLLLISSRILVWGAVGVAEFFGVSDVVIGLTIVALGTSLPELAAAIASTLKKEPDLVIGNVIGSNMFNLLAVLGVPGVLHPATLDRLVLTRDIPVMTGLTIALLLLAYRPRGRESRINRIAGALFVSVYLGYQGLVYFSAVA